jgi:hypothetical protein
MKPALKKLRKDGLRAITRRSTKLQRNHEVHYHRFSQLIHLQQLFKTLVEAIDAVKENGG